jgi:AcrR family transcriptional regulator
VGPTGRDVSARRRRPIQARSRATYERILSAAAELITEVGWDGLNTNAIAARAGLTVPSVYAYFPDKYAIVHELFDRYEQERMQALTSTVERARDDGDWEESLRRMMLTALELRPSRVGGVALRNAMAAVPELRRLDEESSERAALHLARMLQDAAPELPFPDACRAARVVTYAVVPLLDHAARVGAADADGERAERSAALVEEAARMAILYLRHTLRGATGC